jgi:hypothetical protein
VRMSAVWWSVHRVASCRSAGGTVRPLAAVLLAGALVLLLRGESLLVLASPGQCSYLRQTGRPCVGCGGTRAYALAVAGHVCAAAKTNVLGAFAGAAVWLLALGSAVSLATGRSCFLWVCAATVALVGPLALTGSMVVWWHGLSQYIL